MKPAAFEYVAPRTLADVISALQLAGEEGKLLAGGQSLVPLMHMRLSRPRVLVDLNTVGELGYIREWDRGIALGALTRQRAVEGSELVKTRCPLLSQAVPFVGHLQIRNRGTVAGSLAHADPAAELPGVISALEAEMVIQGPAGERVLRADEFFLNYLTTALEEGEVLKEIRIPPWPDGAGSAFLEVSRSHGNFALAGVAIRLALDETGACIDPRIALIGVGPTPIRAREAEALLSGDKPTDDLFREAAAKAARAAEPESDVHASADYRRHVTGVLTRRALQQALACARRS